MNFKSSMKIQGQFQLLTYKHGKLIDSYTEKNKIVNAGREAIVTILAGERPNSRVSKLELGIGAYGIGQIVDPNIAPPNPPDDQVDLVLKTNPTTVYAIDPATNVIIPPDNPLCRIYTVVLENLPNNFDVGTYKGYSEFALKMEAVTHGGTTYPEILFASKTRKPILGDGETIYVVRWRIFV